MLSDDTNKVLIGALLKSEHVNLSSLLEIFNTNGWPSSEIIKIGVNYAIRDMAPYGTINRSHKTPKNQGLDKLWETFIAHSNLMINRCPPMLLNHILFKGYSCAVQQMLTNTPPSELKVWLSEKDIHSSFHDTGRDKCSNFGLLVQNGSIEVMQALVDLDPTYLYMQDHKKRTALFYARNVEMVAYLSGKNVDASLKDKDGFDAVQTWTEILKHPEASQWMDALAQVDTPSRVVQKMLSMQLNTLTDEEKQSFTNSVQRNAIWQGNLFGCEKDWTLSEIWNFTLVLHAVNLLKSPTLKNYYFYGNDNLIRRDPAGFKDTIVQQQQCMPLDLQTQISQKTNQSLALQWLISLCKQWDGSPNRLIEVDEDYIKKNTTYYSSKDNVGGYLTSLDKILENSTENDRREFASSLSPYVSLTDVWTAPTVLQRFAQANHMFVLPLEKGGVLSTQLASSIAFLRLNEGLRSSAAVSHWVSHFKNYTVPAWDKDVKNQEDLQKWSPVLQLGLSYSPLTANMNTPAVHAMNSTLQDMLMHNVEIEKIPARFAKHMPDNLRSAASRWVINKTLSTKIKPKDEPEVPRRRM